MPHLGQRAGFLEPVPGRGVVRHVHRRGRRTAVRTPELERHLAMEGGIVRAPHFAEAAFAHLLDRAQQSPHEHRGFVFQLVRPPVGPLVPREAGTLLAVRVRDALEREDRGALGGVQRAQFGAVRGLAVREPARRPLEFAAGRVTHAPAPAPGRRWRA